LQYVLERWPEISSGLAEATRQRDHNWTRAFAPFKQVSAYGGDSPATMALPLVRGIAFVAKDVPIILRIIPVRAVHHVANALCRLSASYRRSYPFSAQREKLSGGGPAELQMPTERATRVR